MIRSAFVALGALVLLGAAGGCAPVSGGGSFPVAQGAPTLTRYASGATAVSFPNGCVVAYDRTGRRSGSEGCRPEQVSRADAMVQREAGSGGGGAPRIAREANGAATLRFADGCVVTYNREGRRSGSRGCTPAQVQRADRAYQEDAAARGAGGLRMRRLAGGAAEVTFDDGCVVTYNRRGERTASRGCRPAQVERADRHVQRNWRN